MGRSTKAPAFAALLALLSWVAPGQTASSRLELVMRLWAVGEVRVVEGARSRTLERFATPQQVQAAEISPDHRRAFVWHHGDRPPLHLSIYDLERTAKLVEFSPGFGGELHFTPRSNIIHTWGCGSNCHSFAVYDVQGRTVVNGVSAGIEVSADQKLLLTFPSFIGASEPIALYDLDTGKQTFSSDAVLKGLFVVDAINWLRDGRIEVSFTAEDGAERRLILEQSRSDKPRASYPEGLPERSQ